MARETIYKWLRNNTSDLDYGFLYEGHPIHCNNKETILAYLGHERQWLGRITNKMFDEHFKEEKTYYYTGNQDGPQTLVNIDIDSHKIGSLKGAKKLAKALKRFFGKNLYYEPSTNGRGVHLYFVIHANGRYSSLEVNALLKRLWKALQSWLGRNPFDVSDIEIKGMCPLVHVDDRKIVNATCGSLAKVPRHATLEDLKRTPHLTLEQIEEIIEALMKDAPVEVETPVLEKASGSISGKCIQPELIPIFTEYATSLLGKYDEVAVNVPVLPFGESNLSFLLVAPLPLKVYRDEYKTPYLQTQNKLIKQVTVNDLAYSMLILLSCSLDMEKNGAMPIARIKAFWDSCYESGDFKKKFDGSVFKVCRDFLDSMDWIDWKDNTYVIGSIVNGKYEKGVACKWKLTRAAIEQLSALKEAVKEQLIRLGTTKADTTTSSIDIVLSLLDEITFNPIITTPICLTQTITWWDYEPELIELLQQAA